MNNKLSVNDIFGIIKYNKRTNSYISVVLTLINFNKTNLLYDLKVITTNRTNYKYKFKDVAVYFEIENNGRIRTIY